MTLRRWKRDVQIIITVGLILSIANVVLALTRPELKRWMKIKSHESVCAIEGVETMSKLTIHFGALAPPLTEQIKNLPEKYEENSQAITRLFLHGLLTEAETHKARKRLVKAIEKWDADEQ